MSLKSILNAIFWSDSAGDNMSFYKLYSKIRQWRDSKIYPYDYELPPKITFTDDFWKQVIKMYKHTLADKHERAVSVFWADGDLIFSSQIRGTTKSVTPSNNVRVSYKPSHKQGYYIKEVFVDNERRIKKDVYHTKKPKEIEVKYLFNLHTHPPHEREQGNVYSFFSLQDIKSLLSSNAVITGMIGDKLWLLFRTHKTPPRVPQDWDNHDITIEKLTEDLGLALYSGDFKTPLIKHTSQENPAT